MAKKKKLATGPTRMKELGYKDCRVWFTGEQWGTILKAAKRQSLKPSAFIRNAAMLGTLAAAALAKSR